MKKRKGLYIYNIENEINPTELMIISVIKNTCKKNSKLKRTGFKEVCYLTNKQIADILCLDERTIKVALNNLIKECLILENIMPNDYDPDIIEVYDEDLESIENKEPRYLTISNNIKFKKSRFKGFMIPTNILEAKDLSISEKLVFSYLNTFDNQQKDCIAKTKTIQEICKINNIRTVQKIINKFKSWGLISSNIENGNKRIIKTNNINMVNFIANVSQVLNINHINTLQIDNIENMENITKVDNIGNIENVQNIHINMMDLSKVDLSKATREELFKMYKSAKNLVEIYRLALNAKVDK